MIYPEVAAQIIRLKNTDLLLRSQLIQKGELGEGYHPEMEQLHLENTAALNEIIDRIGYPTVDKVGQESSEAAWLIIQHSIGSPLFMKKCAKLLEQAVKESRANPIQLAYLTDRIAVFENHPQLFGTQFDWDENGELSPSPCDDVDQVNERRRSIGLPPLKDQIRRMREQATAEKQSPPTDWAQWKKQSEEWRKKAGWIN